MALAQAGIPFEVVPGVSSALAVPAYAGIPVTHRGLASSVTFVTGHEDPTREGSTVNWEALATVGGTLVILMGVTTLPLITHRLLKGGLPPETPAAVIQEGTLLEQRVVEATLANIAECAALANVKSPALTVIGTVVDLRAALAWFEATHPYVSEAMI